MFYIMLERKTHLAKPSQVPPSAWHSTALWTIDWGWILGNIQIWLVSAPSTAFLSEIIESYGNAKRPTRDHQRDWNTDCTILHDSISRGACPTCPGFTWHWASPGQAQHWYSVSPVVKESRPANVGPRVQDLGTCDIQDSLKRWKKPSKIEWFPFRAFSTFHEWKTDHLLSYPLLGPSVRCARIQTPPRCHRIPRHTASACRLGLEWTWEAMTGRKGRKGNLVTPKR